MSLTKDIKNFIFPIFSTVIASIILFILLSISEVNTLTSRVDALEKSDGYNSVKLDQIQKKVDDIHWYLIEKNDRINNKR